MDSGVHKIVVGVVLLIAAAGLLLDVTGWPDRDGRRIVMDDRNVASQATQDCLEASPALDERAKLLSVDPSGGSTACAWVMPARQPSARRCAGNGGSGEALDVIRGRVVDGSLVELEPVESDAVVCEEPG